MSQQSTFEDKCAQQISDVKNTGRKLALGLKNVKGLVESQTCCEKSVTNGLYYTYEEKVKIKLDPQTQSMNLLDMFRQRD